MPPDSDLNVEVASLNLRRIGLAVAEAVAATGVAVGGGLIVTGTTAAAATSPPAFVTGEPQTGRLEVHLDNPQAPRRAGLPLTEPPDPDRLLIAGRSADGSVPRRIEAIRQESASRPALESQGPGEGINTGRYPEREMNEDPLIDGFARLDGFAPVRP